VSRLKNNKLLSQDTKGLADVRLESEKNTKDTDVHTMAASEEVTTNIYGKMITMIAVLLVERNLPIWQRRTLCWKCEQIRNSQK